MMQSQGDMKTVQETSFWFPASQKQQCENAGCVILDLRISTAIGAMNEIQKETLFHEFIPRVPSGKSEVINIKKEIGDISDIKEENYLGAINIKEETYDFMDKMEEQGVSDITEDTTKDVIYKQEKEVIYNLVPFQKTESENVSVQLEESNSSWQQVEADGEYWSDDRKLRCRVYDNSFGNFYETEEHKCNLNLSGFQKSDDGYVDSSLEDTHQEFSEYSHMDKEETPFCCDMCDKLFNNINDLRSHICPKICKTKLHCSICKKSFVQNGTLTMHMLAKHSKNRNIFRNKFKRTVSQSTELIQHCHVGPFSCDVCNSSFTCKKYHTAHIATHSDVPFSCAICKKSFFWKSRMYTHMRSHTRERPYSCNKCDKSFSWKHLLKEHLQTHGKSQRDQLGLRCNLCNKLFSKTSNLKRHNCLNSANRIHCCNICQKSFLSNGDLKKHHRTHTGERPFSCDVCNKTFSQNCSVIRHMRRHTGDRPFNCDICNKSFPRKDVLKAHMVHHKADNL